MRQHYQRPNDAEVIYAEVIYAVPFKFPEKIETKMSDSKNFTYFYTKLENPKRTRLKTNDLAVYIYLFRRT